MIRAVADTHALLWFLYQDPRLSPNARTVMLTAEQSGDHIAFSSITLVEIAYLIEKQRIASNSYERVTDALDIPFSFFRETPLTRNVADALRQIDRAQVPDMPDRIIAATALMLNVPVISRDHKIQASIVQTIW